MKNEDMMIIRKMIRYCSDIENLMNRFDRDYDKYTNDISFQYSCKWNTLQEDIPELRDNLIAML